MDGHIHTPAKARRDMQTSPTQTGSSKNRQFGQAGPANVNCLLQMQADATSDSYMILIILSIQLSMREHSGSAQSDLSRLPVNITQKQCVWQTAIVASCNQLRPQLSVAITHNPCQVKETTECVRQVLPTFICHTQNSGRFYQRQ